MQIIPFEYLNGLFVGLPFYFDKFFVCFSPGNGLRLHIIDEIKRIIQDKNLYLMRIRKCNDRSICISHG